eukprot:3133921-Prymnesium_polylepis.1
MQLVHHDEPGLHRPLRAARQPQGALPYGRDDGARLRDDRRGGAALERLPRGRPARAQDIADAQALLGAALVAGPLRLRHTRCDGGGARGRQPEAADLRRGRGRAGTPLDHRRQPAQVFAARRSAVRGHHERPVPGHRAPKSRTQPAQGVLQAALPESQPAADREVLPQDHAAVRDDHRAPRPHDCRLLVRRQDVHVPHARRRAHRDEQPRRRRAQGAILRAQPQVDHDGAALRPVRPGDPRVERRHPRGHLPESGAAG